MEIQSYFQSNGNWKHWRDCLHWIQWMSFTARENPQQQRLNFSKSKKEKGLSLSEFLFDKEILYIWNETTAPKNIFLPWSKELHRIFCYYTVEYHNNAYHFFTLAWGVFFFQCEIIQDSSWLISSRLSCSCLLILILLVMQRRCLSKP